MAPTYTVPGSIKLIFKQVYFAIIPAATDLYFGTFQGNLTSVDG